MDWLAVLAVIGTLAGVGVGGIIGYEGQKRLQKRQRELDLDEQQRQRKRNQLEELSNEFNSLAIRSHELKILKATGLKYSEQENKDYINDTAKANVSLGSFPHKELLILLFSRHPNHYDGDLDQEDFNQELQPIIQELIDDTYDPDFSTTTSSSLENYGVDPDEYQKFLDNLSKSKFTETQFLIGLRQSQ